MLVEARGAKDAQSLHDGEARSVDDREILVGEVLADREGDIEIGGDDGLDRDRTGPDRPPEPLCRVTAEPVRDQKPGLDEHVVARHEPLSGGNDLLRARVAAVTAIGRGVERRGVDEERQ